MTSIPNEEVERSAAPWLYKRVSDGWTTVENDDFVAALKMAYEIANFTKDGERDPSDPYDVDGFIMENDDAYDTLHDLISQAREIYGMDPRVEPLVPAEEQDD